MAKKKSIEHMSDEELVAHIRSKDQEAYAHLVRRYQDKLIRYASYLLKSKRENKQRAKDVVQESFIKAFVNLKGFDVDKKFSSWIYRIVHNESMNVLRKKKRETSLDAFSWSEKFFSTHDKNVEELQHEDMKIMLEDSLDELEDMYKAPLVLFYLEEKSYDEISDILKLPIGTVGTRISRGKKYMRDIVEQKGGLAYV